MHGPGAGCVKMRNGWTHCSEGDTFSPPCDAHTLFWPLLNVITMTRGNDLAEEEEEENLGGTD